MLVEEAVGRGHTKVAELVLGKLMSMRLSPDPCLLLSGDVDDDSDDSELDTRIVKASNSALLALTLSPEAIMLPARLLKTYKARCRRDKDVGHFRTSVEQRWTEDENHGVVQQARVKEPEVDVEGVSDRGGNERRDPVPAIPPRVTIVKGVIIKRPRGVPKSREQI